MTFVVSFVDYRPVARYDGVPWTDALIEESESRDGPWNQIDDVALLPPDADPSAPAVRSFTTAKATLESGWYRVTFADASGGRSETDPISGSASVAVPPSPDQLRQSSTVLQTAFPSDPVDADVETALRTLTAESVTLVEQLTCRTLDNSLPADLQGLAFRAVRLKAERMALTEGAARSRTLGNALLKSINAGPWSETYFGPGDALTAGVLDMDPATNEALWSLATEDCRLQWIREWAMRQGKQFVFPPAGMAEGVDWFPEGVSQPHRLGAYWPGYGLDPELF